MANKFATQNGAGTKTGGSWANAFDYAQFHNDVSLSVAAGDVYYVYGMGDTYTLTRDFYGSTNGTNLSYIKIIGVQDQLATPTEATIENAPAFICGGNFFFFENYWEVRNVKCTGSGVDFCGADTGSRFTNVYAYNNSGVNFRKGIQSNGGLNITDCGARSDNGYAVIISTGGTITGCYVHDSYIGFEKVNSSMFNNNVITKCSYGINIQNGNNQRWIGNTIYSCSVAGIYGTTGQPNVFINNDITYCAVGAEWTGANYQSNYFDYNNWSGNTTDVTNVTKGTNALGVDPEYEDGPGGNFAPGDNIRGVGVPGQFITGNSTSYIDIGGVQGAAVGGAAGGGGIIYS